MKIKETKNGNIKITFTAPELRVLMSIVQHVRLGDGPNSDVIFELYDGIDSINQNLTENLNEISILTEIDNGVVSHIISV